MVSATSNSDQQRSADPRSKSASNLKSASPDIYALLSSLRNRIRACICVEGFAAALATAVLLFWIALALDYVPVLLGFNELSWPIRAFLLVASAVLVLAVVYRLVLRRVFVSMKNRSMALLVENRYPEFTESLITTVESADSARDDVPVDDAMLSITKNKAERLAGEVDVRRIANSQPAIKMSWISALLLLSLVGFAIASPSNLRVAAQRIYMLDGQLWPRKVNLEMIGLKVKREAPVQGIAEFGQTLLPIDGEFRIAKGSSATLLVRAESSLEVGAVNGSAIDVAAGDGSDAGGGKQPPKSCSIRYWSKDGSRGSQVLNRVGNVRDGWQLFTLNGSPLQGMLSELSFDLRGEDHRIGPFKIKVVDEAVITEADLNCVYPEYMVDAESGRWTARAKRWTGNAALPIGTVVKIVARCNKPLRKVYALDFTNQSMHQAVVTEDGFEFGLAPITASNHWHFYLVDEDQVVTEQPYIISIEPIDDTPPSVLARLKGIGSAVTPNVVLPIKGKVEDDYGVQRTWVEVETPSTDTLVFDQFVQSDGELVSQIDFLEEQRNSGFKLPVDEGAELSLIVKSEDFYSLEGSPTNVGVGDKFTLEIVSPNKLLRLLERLEVDQRRRLEQIFNEVSDVRGYLVKTMASKSNNLGVAEPGDRQQQSDGAADSVRRKAMRLLFAQRSTLQVTKSSQEILGVAEAFSNIRMQLENNRIDSADRKERLENRIVEPLRAMIDQPVAKLQGIIGELEKTLSQIDSGLGGDSTEALAKNQSESAIVATDKVLMAIDGVLSVLVKYETQNELLDIVRQLIEEQKSIMEETKKKRQRDAFEGLLDE